MSNGDWCSKEIVFKDLAKARGRSFQIIDSELSFVGERPPPLRSCKIDDSERKLYFGDYRTIDIDSNVMKPDLEGIRYMLRLVKERDKSTESISDVKTCISSPSPNFNNVISISKLNPNVKEFIPKSTINHSVDLKQDIVVKDSEVRSYCENELCSKDNVFKDCVTPENTQKETNLNDVQAIVTALKKKITTEPTTFQAKRERNVAIANLQKLYSLKSNPVSNGIDGNKEITLKTPAFFEQSKDKENKEEEYKPSNAEFSNCNSARTDCIVKENNKPSTEDVSNCDSARRDSIIEGNPSNAQVQDSIKKVQNWFNKADDKHRPKGPVVYLSPVEFKRKTYKQRQSPIEKEKVPEPKQNTTKQYVPSQYATELAKIFMERSKVKKMTNDRVSYDNLFGKLKEKDLEIKARLENVSLASSSNEIFSSIDTGTLTE